MTADRFRISRIGGRVTGLALVAAAMLAAPVAWLGWLPELAGPGILALFLSSFLQLAAFALAVMLVFHKMVARHLVRIADQAEAPVFGTAPMITLKRRRRAPDSLDGLVNAVNAARADGFDAHKTQTQRLSKLAQLHERLTDIYQEQSKFAYALSHDLKTPSNSINMLLAEFRDTAGGEISAEAEATLQELDWAADRLDQLIRDVLDYSRTLHLEHAEEDVDLEALVQDIVHDISATLSQSDARITIGPLPIARGSAFQLRALFKNLLSNAVKFHKEGETPLIEITAQPAQSDGWVEISVTDNGIGIPADLQSKVFGMFARLNAQSNYAGAGVGLALCQQIVAAHRGRIELRSEPGRGSTFSVTLPGRIKTQVAAPMPIAGGARVFRMGLSMAPTHPWSLAAEAFALALAEASAGALKAQVLPMQQASNAEYVLGHVESGALDIALIPAADISDLVPDFGCLFTPFLADDPEHAARILKSETANGLFDRLTEKTGLIGAGFATGGMRFIICRQEVSTEQDLARLKIRIPHYVPIVDFYQLVTSDPVPVPLQNVMEAFEKGRIDATDSSAVLAYTMGYYKHAKVLLNTNHMIFPGAAVVSQRLWKELGPGDRALVKDLLRKHVEATHDTFGISEDRAFLQLREVGVKIREMDRSLFERAIQDWINLWLQRSPALEGMLDIAEATRTPHSRFGT